MALFKTLITGLGLALMSLSVSAHHSTNGIYNEEVEVELTGTVKQWRFINPHPSLLLDVVGPDGKIQEWDISYGGSAVAHLTRRGYKVDTFETGDRIKVKGFAAKVSTAYGLLIQGNPTHEDGTEIP